MKEENQQDVVYLDEVKTDPIVHAIGGSNLSRSSPVPSPAYAADVPFVGIAEPLRPGMLKDELLQGSSPPGSPSSIPSQAMMMPQSDSMVPHPPGDPLIMPPPGMGPPPPGTAGPPPPPPTNTAVPYNPFQNHTIDENKLIYRRLYDKKYQDFMRDVQTRVAHQLALAYFRDANISLSSILNELREKDIVLLDREDKNNNNSLHLIFVKNCLRHLNVTAEEFEDIQMSTSQILLLSDDISLSANSLSKISQFVTTGGVVLSFNKAITIVTQIVPNIINYRNGETVTDKEISVSIPESDDKELFMGLLNAAQRKKCVRFIGTRRLIVKPEALQSGVVQILAEEVSPGDCPLVLKIHHGGGLIFHISPVGTNEVMELHSQQKVVAYCKQVDSSPGISLSTKSAWKTAMTSGLGDAFYLAISLLPMLDILFGIIKKYRHFN